MIDTLAAGATIIERTASTARVQEIVQLSLAPVFLLAAIGAMLNVMNARLIWLADRAEKIEHDRDVDEAGREVEELPDLRQRQYLAQAAVNLSTLAALTICLVVALLFVSAFIEPRIGTAVAVLWIATMAQLSIALTFFFLETRLATATARERRKRSRQLMARKIDADSTD